MHVEGEGGGALDTLGVVVGVDRMDTLAQEADSEGEDDPERVARDTEGKALGEWEGEGATEVVGLGEREALVAPDCVADPLGLGEPLRLAPPDPVPGTGVPLCVPDPDAMKEGEESAEAEPMDALATPLADTSGLRLPLVDRDCVEVGRGDLDTEGERLPEALGRGERVREGVADSERLTAEEGEEDRDTPPLPLILGLRELEREASPEADREALGDRVGVAMLDGLGLGDKDTVAEAKGDLLLLPVAFPEVEGRGVRDREAVEEGVRGELGDFPPLTVPPPTPPLLLLGVPVGTTLCEPEAVVEAEERGVGEEDPVNLDRVGAGDTVSPGEVVAWGVVERERAGDAVAKDPVAPGDSLAPGDTDTVVVVVVDWEAGRVATEEPLPPALGVDVAEAQAEGEGSPELDPDPLPRAVTEEEREVWGLWDALGDTLGVRDGRGERVGDRVPVATPLWLPLPLPAPLRLGVEEPLGE